MTDMKRELFCTIFKREVVHAEKNHQATGEEEEEVVHLTGDQRKDAEEAVGAEFFRHKTLPLSNISVSQFHQPR